MKLNTQWKHKRTGYLVTVERHNERTGRVFLRGETGRYHKSRAWNLRAMYTQVEA